MCDPRPAEPASPARSASPPSVTAVTSCPAARSGSATASHAHAPSHMPGTRMKFVMRPTLGSNPGGSGPDSDSALEWPVSQSTGRVLALLEVLQARPGLTGPQLAERLGVDERTVRRYAAALADLG